MSAILKRKETTLLLLGLSFAIVIFPYYLEIPSLNKASQDLILMVSVLNAMSIILAIYSQTKRSLLMVNQKAHGWPYQLYLIISIYLMTTLGLVYGQQSASFLWLQYALINPTDSAIYSLLAFYMASACARAFRARSPQAALLLISGTLVLIGQAPLTGTFWPGAESIETFLSETFAMTASRVFSISVTVGAIVLGVRILTGRESSALGMEGN